MNKYDFETFVSVRRERGDEVVGHCPFHDDRNPSFSANVATGLWKCHAGCGGGTYSSFLKAIRGGGPSQPIAETTREEKRLSQDDWALYRKVAEYVYFDLEGRRALRVTRLEKETGEKTFHQAHLDKAGNWVKGGTYNLLLPYRYQHWCDSPEKRIVIVEGEKCADFLFGLGFEATTFAGGSNGWKAHYASYFVAKEVIILPDNDEPGQKFAEAVATDLKKLTYVRVVALPELGHGEDVVDWIKGRGNAGDFRDLIS